MPVSPAIERLFRPLYLLYLSASFFPGTIAGLLLAQRFSTLLSWSEVQHAWFARFWSYFGPRCRQDNAPTVEPLIENAQGCVLDIGPGSGEWLYLYAGRDKITQIYGVEPNIEHHGALRKAVKRAGLEDKYIILPVGAGDLHDCGIAKDFFDTIVTIQCLCSIPDPRKVLQGLYPYLRSNGTWVVYEHIKVHDAGSLTGQWQALIDYVWPYFLGGCSLTRPTDMWLLQIGNWSQVDLHPGPDASPFDPIPMSIGSLIKA